jgi:type 2 lantibiotic biosynthesis protein LanM
MRPFIDPRAPQLRGQHQDSPCLAQGAGVEAAGWYRALTLSERLSLPRATAGQAGGEEDAARAARRAQRWRAEPPFGTAALFAERLAMDGMTEEDFLHLLGEPIESIPARLGAPPNWLARLARAFAQRPSDDGSLPPLLAGCKPELAELLRAIAPMISEGLSRLRAGARTLAAHSHLAFNPDSVEEVLSADLAGQLVTQAARTLTLELNVARLQGQLEGETPAERFRSFTRLLRRPERALALLQEYPVLARQLTTCINDWVAASLQFLGHLLADWVAIWNTFNPTGRPGALVRVEGMGDRHRGGRGVRIAEFSPNFRVVYKPRSLAVDVHFQQLLTWLNERGADPPFRPLQVIDRGTHGWVEFVSPQGCTRRKEVERFYRRLGGLLAVLDALEATDFHHENLIAAGEQPVPLDLEALFHPRLAGTPLEERDRLAGSVLNDSVLRVGLLPNRFLVGIDSEGIDVSGIGAPGSDQPTLGAVPCLEGAGTDEMRFAHCRAMVSGRPNRPSMNGAAVDVREHADAIAAGFTGTYRLLAGHRDELLSPSGPLSRFDGDEVRVVARPTEFYAQLLRDGFHPDVLRDALDRDRLFDRLWTGTEHLPHLKRLIPAERADLWQNDIPLFTTRPGSRDLWTSKNERLADFLPEPGLALARRRLGRLNEQDLAQQLHIVRASLATLGPVQDRPRRPRPVAASPVGADRERILAAARAVGDRLAALALRGQQAVCWIGLTLRHPRCWSLAPLGLDLYSGLPGVALFLAYLGAVTGEDRPTALAQAALSTLRRQMEQQRSALTSIGGFGGWGGLIYTLAHLGTLWPEPDLLREAEAVVPALPALIQQDEQLDVISGSAGCIGGLLALHRCAASSRTLAAATCCGDRLLARARQVEGGIGWVIPGAGGSPLAGFSHGAAGMAWALLELAAATGAERFRTAALAALAYERSVFCPATGNWPDLREPEPSAPSWEGRGPGFMTAWCHGAPGIGLARLQTLPYLDDATTRAEIRVALQTTLAEGFGANHCLCHGDLGNLELPLQASEMLPSPALSPEVSRRAGTILDDIDRHGWLCGSPADIESPGLMTGLAGIGYGLLRLAAPDQVPSVLVLAPPPGL